MPGGAPTPCCRRNPARLLRTRAGAGLSKIIPAFAATPEGKGVAVTTSYAVSGDQSRAVVDGKPRRHHHQLLCRTRCEPPGQGQQGLERGRHQGNPVAWAELSWRKGNPKNIKDWDDLLQPVSKRCPEPREPSAKWNLAGRCTPPEAASAVKISRPGSYFVNKLVTEHVKTRPGSGREATNVLGGHVYAVISYENEAINVERQGKPVEHIDLQDRLSRSSPPQRIDKATALKNYL